MHRKISVVLQAHPIGQLIHGYIFMGHDLDGPLKPDCVVNLPTDWPNSKLKAFDFTLKSHSGNDCIVLIGHILFLQFKVE